MYNQWYFCLSQVGFEPFFSRYDAKRFLFDDFGGCCFCLICTGTRRSNFRCECFRFSINECIYVVVHCRDNACTLLTGVPFQTKTIRPRTDSFIRVIIDKLWPYALWKEDWTQFFHLLADRVWSFIEFDNLIEFFSIFILRVVFFFKFFFFLDDLLEKSPWRLTLKNCKLRDFLLLWQASLRALILAWTKWVFEGFRFIKALIFSPAWMRRLCRRMFGVIKAGTDILIRTCR